jgi:hypothetical protein
MSVRNRLLLRGLRKNISDGSSVLAIEDGVSDSLGATRNVTAVLTSDALLLASPVRARTILVVIPRGDIQSIEFVEPAVADVSFDDFQHALRRVVRLDLSRRGDRAGIIEQLEAWCDGK